jgi:branched-chain amino acid aminotransferase
MLEIKWSEAKGWEKPQISPLHNFSLHPASKVLHYAQGWF